MIGSWQLANEPIWKRHIAYAAAYLEGARTLCAAMIERKVSNWPEANVVLFLAVHSMELFLKGAILCRDQNAKFETYHHLGELFELYEEYYSDSRFRLDRWFDTEYLNFPIDEIKELRDKEQAPSIYYRFPAQRSGVDWPGVYAVEPEAFSDILDAIRESQRRLAQHFE